MAAVPQPKAGPNKNLPTSSGQLTAITLGVVVLAMFFLFLRLAAQEKVNLVESKRAAASAVSNLLAKALVAPLDLQDDQSVAEQLQHLRSNPEVRAVAVWRAGNSSENPLVELSPPQATRLVRPPNGSSATESIQIDSILVVRPITTETVSKTGHPVESTLLGLVAIEFSLNETNQAIHASRVRVLGLATGLALFLAVVIGGVQRRAMSAQEVVNRELADLNKLKDEFLANTSHELRTPLNGIIGLTEALLDDAALSPNARRSLSMIGTSGRRLANLVNDILDFSKLDEGGIILQRRRMDVHALAERVILLTKPLLGPKPIQLFTTMEATTPWVYADSNRLEQILLNLVGNAVKFTERGSIIISASVERETLVVEVRDTGIGIAPEHHASIFQAFQQADGTTARKYGGTGLGLTVTKKLVELHGGTLGLESRLNHGASFTFTLPLAAEIASEPEEALFVIHSPQAALDGSFESASGRFILAQSGLPPAPAPRAPSVPVSAPASSTLAPRSTTRVLIVDDEPVNRAVLVQQLNTRGYDLHEATDGVDAVEWIRANGAPDVVLLDVMMPRMNGYDTLRHLRETFPKATLPVLLLTAKNREIDIVEGFNSGANDYVTKPFTRSELEARVDHHLQLKRSGENLQVELLRRTELEGSLLDLSAKESAALVRVGELELAHRGVRSELHAAESQLIQAEKLASLGQSIASIAHEIGNPIGYISGSADLIGLELDEMESAVSGAEAVRLHGSAMRSSLEDIQTGVEKVREISKAMRNVSRTDSTPTADVSLAELTREALVILGGRISGFAVENTVNPAHTVRCRRSHIGQVVMNLVANGCDALREHREKQGAASCGKLRVSSETLPDRTVVLLVEDDGPGVPEHLRAKILEPFFTTKPAGVGTGLGLAVIHKIVLQHGGRLLVERSTALGGARFEVHLLKECPDE